MISRLLSGAPDRRLRVPGVSTSASAVRREANPVEPNRLLVAEMVTVAGTLEPLYLCAVLDCCSGRCLAWRPSGSPDAALIADAVRAAAESRPHRLAALDRTPLGRPVALALSRRCADVAFTIEAAVPADSAAARVATRFAAFLRADLLLAASWGSRLEAVQAIAEWVDAYYNPAVAAPPVALRYREPGASRDHSGPPG